MVEEQVYVDSIWDLELSVLEHAESWEQLKSSFNSILRVIANQATNEDPFFQVAIISAAFRKVARKAGEILLKTDFKGKIALEDFAWLSFGGEARREVTLKFDQDNGIIFLKKTRVIEEFAEEMVDRLAWLKIAKCIGGVMASRPEWQGDLNSWIKRIDYLLSGTISEEDLRRLTILLDVDFVFGNKELYDGLVKKIAELYPKAFTVKRQLARDIMDIPRYLDIFGRLAVETRHDRLGKFNFKFACLYPFVGVVRIEAWDKGIVIAATRHRLKFLRDKNFISPREYEERISILKDILDLRLTQQRRQLASGQDLSDYFDLKLFNFEELKRLKNVVKKVEKLKKKLEWLYWA